MHADHCPRHNISQIQLRGSRGDILQLNGDHGQPRNLHSNEGQMKRVWREWNGESDLMLSKYSAMQAVAK